MIYLNQFNLYYTIQPSSHPLFIMFKKLFLITLVYLCSIECVVSKALPNISWKMSQSELIEKFHIEVSSQSSVLRSKYKLYGHDFMINFSMNNQFVVAFSLQYLGKDSKAVFVEIMKSFQGLYGPGKHLSTSNLEKFECRQDRNTDLRMMLIKKSLIILVTPKRKF